MGKAWVQHGFSHTRDKTAQDKGSEDNIYTQGRVETIRGEADNRTSGKHTGGRSKLLLLLQACHSELELYRRVIFYDMT